MKRLLIAVFLIPFLSYSQPKIMGIGKFQIGKCSTSTIADLSKEFNTPIKETADDLATRDEFNYSDTPSKILYISKEANEGKLFAHASYISHPAVKVYYINNFRIADLLFHDIYLKFYKDTLYYFEADGNEYIDSALQLKYGAPKITKTSKVIRCSNAYRDFEHEEWSYFMTWNNALKHIVATNTHSAYYDDKCHKQFMEFLTVYDTKKVSLIETQIARDAKLEQEKYDAEKKKTLGGL